MENQNIPGPDLELPKEEFVIGFKEDCYNLLTKFSASKDKRFKDFAEVWREMHFSFVFGIYGIIEFEDEEELATFMHEAIPEIFLIAKCFLLPDFPHSYNKGAFYLLYALYFKQPSKSGVCSHDWGIFEISLDPTELGYLAGVYNAETDEESKKELRILYQQLDEEGAINYKTTLHCPKPYCGDNLLRAVYYLRLLDIRIPLTELYEDVEDDDDEDDVEDWTENYTTAVDKLGLFEELWGLTNKGGRTLSPVLRCSLGDEEPDSDSELVACSSVPNFRIPATSTASSDSDSPNPVTGNSSSVPHSSNLVPASSSSIPDSSVSVPGSSRSIADFVRPSSSSVPQYPLVILP